jgi:membrane-associated phospholipid phosphatase
MATANHFWLDVLAGIVVAAASLVVVSKTAWLGGKRDAPAQQPIANLL